MLRNDIEVTLFQSVLSTCQRELQVKIDEFYNLLVLFPYMIFCSVIF